MIAAVNGYALGGGCSTFAMIAPGAVQIHNAVPSTNLGTTYMAGAVNGFLACGFMLVVGIIYLHFWLKKAKNNGEHFVAKASDDFGDDANESLPNPIVALLPLVITICLVNIKVGGVVIAPVEVGVLAGAVSAVVLMIKYIDVKQLPKHFADGAAMALISITNTCAVNGFGDATTSCSLSGGICAALYQKAKTGKGCKVMVSLFAQAIWSESAGMVSTQYGDEYPKTRLNPGSPVMDTFKSSDGKWFYMSILEPDRYNDALFKELGLNELIGNPDYSTAVGSKAHTAELVAILSKAFAQHTMDDISGMFARADIAYDRVQHIKEVLDDPQALENMYIVPMANKDGTVTKQPATPIRFALTEPTCIEDIAPTMDRQAPMVGEHSAEILREYGYSDADIERFLADKVITIEKL